ncbi:MAG: alkaline phosphatase family protein, partial [Chloroflexota bacterium]|nr:alkaline phosphatase family protein [Chloroflexota bacterium]
VYERLNTQGVSTVVVNHEQFEGTSLSRINHRGARYEGFLTVSDLAVNLRAAILSTPRPAYIHSYWGMLDTVAHAYGTDSAQHSAEIRVIDHALGQILLPGLEVSSTLILILADHGHINAQHDRQLWFNDYPELLAMLQAPPAGLDRAAILYVLPECEAEARHFAERELAGVADVLTAEESVASGLYGPEPLSPRARQRLGQLLLLPRENWVMRYQYPGKERRIWSVGKHGGLSEQEMLVPMLALRLG